MADYKWLCNTETGLAGQYPAHYEGLFGLEAAEEVGCVDCSIQTDPEPETEDIPLTEWSEDDDFLYGEDEK